MWFRAPVEMTMGRFVSCSLFENTKNGYSGCGLQPGAEIALTEKVGSHREEEYGQEEDQDTDTHALL